jgi:hypothetical protein
MPNPKDPVPRPTRHELAGLFSRTPNDRQELALLLRLLRCLETRPDELLPVEAVLALALNDWMSNNALDLSAISRHHILVAMSNQIEAAANQFVEESGVNATRYPVMFTLVDWRYAIFRLASVDNPQFFDTWQSEFVPRLPAHGLTSLTCDLNVLLLRLSGTLEHQREERTDAKPDVDVDQTKPGPGRE